LCSILVRLEFFRRRDRTANDVLLFFSNYSDKVGASQ
jgi:hypothetical protein